MLEYLNAMHSIESNLFSDANAFMTMIYIINAKGFPFSFLFDYFLINLEM